MDPFDFGTGGINREGEMHTTVPCASCLVLSSVIVYFDIRETYTLKIFLACLPPFFNPSFLVPFIPCLLCSFVPGLLLCLVLYSFVSFCLYVCLLVIYLFLCYQLSIQINLDQAHALL